MGTCLLWVSMCSMSLDRGHCAEHALRLYTSPVICSSRQACPSAQALRRPVQVGQRGAGWRG